MYINVYPSYSKSKPLKVRKFVKDIIHAQSYCEWYARNYGQTVNFVIVR